jgi:predicted  nucleic acid-binding Zn-ribbon protein
VTQKQLKGITVKADPQLQRILLDVQEIDNHIAVNRRAQAQIPEVAQRESLATELTSFGPGFIAANGALEDLRAEIARIEDDIKMVDARLAQDIERRDSSASAKDISGFEHEIATLKTRKEALEESELIVMERLEAAESELATISARRDEITSQISALDSKIEAEQARLSAEARSLATERATVTTTVPADLLALYEKQRERYGIGAALLTRGVSGGSGVALTASDLDSVRHAAPDDVVLCPDSSCILIRTEESGL